jgi:hypothetical protein
MRAPVRLDTKTKFDKVFLFTVVGAVNFHGGTVTIGAAMINPWLSFGLKAWQVGLEAQSVIALN